MTIDSACQISLSFFLPSTLSYVSKRSQICCFPLLVTSHDGFQQHPISWWARKRSPGKWHCTDDALTLPPWVECWLHKYFSPSVDSASLPGRQLRAATRQTQDRAQKPLQNEPLQGQVYGSIAAPVHPVLRQNERSE